MLGRFSPEQRMARSGTWLHGSIARRAAASSKSHGSAPLTMPQLPRAIGVAGWQKGGAKEPPRSHNEYSCE